MNKLDNFAALPIIDVSRLAEVQALSLKRGTHEPTDHDFCVMEAVAYVAGEQWSDAPQCACPVIGAFMVTWNDALMSDADRDRLLKPLISELVGTRSTKTVERRRSYIALDWLVRVYTPKLLELVPALASYAVALRDMDAITDAPGAKAAGVTLSAARDAARAVAGDAAESVARVVAGAVAGAAAWAALKPTTEWLQTSAVDLVRRMIAAEAA